MKNLRSVTFNAGARRAFRALTAVEANTLVKRMDEIASRPPEARLPYVRVTEVSNLRVSYEVTADRLFISSITQTS